MLNVLEDSTSICRIHNQSHICVYEKGKLNQMPNHTITQTLLDGPYGENKEKILIIAMWSSSEPMKSF
jgi:hypothetical protein